MSKNTWTEEWLKLGELEGKGLGAKGGVERRMLSIKYSTLLYKSSSETDPLDLPRHM